MQKTLLVVLFLSVSLLLAGCGKKQGASMTPPKPPVPASTTAKNGSTDNTVVPSSQQASQNVLENTTPETANDLPTAINETESDLQVIEKDLRELDQMDMTEESVEL